ncbi:MAG: conserved hypothetical protein [Marine Group I thaumarchaeote]|nr:MAG: conserved hypothetical protein [Marine Group I thaumarchaeote]
MESEKNEVISIRVDSNLKEKLASECKNEHTSMNAVINRALLEYVGWNRHVKQGGWVTIFRSAFRSIIDLVEEKEIIRIGHEVGRDEYRASSKLFFGTVDVDSLTQMIIDYFDHMNVNYQHTTNEGKNRFIVKHDLGKNWVLYFISTVESLFGEIGYMIKKEVACELCFDFEIIKVN